MRRCAAGLVLSHGARPLAASRFPLSNRCESAHAFGPAYAPTPFAPRRRAGRRMLRRGCSAKSAVAISGAGGVPSAVRAAAHARAVRHAARALRWLRANAPVRAPQGGRGRGGLAGLHARWPADLGDAERGERAAEIAD